MTERYRSERSLWWHKRILAVAVKHSYMLKRLNLICIVAALVLSLFGCDTLNASGHLRPLGLTFEHNGRHVPRESIDRMNIASAELKHLNSGIYGDLFETYLIDDALIQPIEGLWSHDVVYTTVLIQNAGASPLRVKLDKAQFVPLEVYKAKRNVGVTFSPYISVVFYDGSTPSSMTIPPEASELRPFGPSNDRRLGWDLVENNMIALENMVREVVRGEISYIELSPGNSTLLHLAFRVGFIKDGRLTLYFDNDRSVTIRFIEMNYFEAKDWLAGKK